MILPSLRVWPGPPWPRLPTLCTYLAWAGAGVAFVREFDELALGLLVASVFTAITVWQLILYRRSAQYLKATIGRVE